MSVTHEAVAVTYGSVAVTQLVALGNNLGALGSRGAAVPYYPNRVILTPLRLESHRGLP